jgi:hypothetical protein
MTGRREDMRSGGLEVMRSVGKRSYESMRSGGQKVKRTGSKEDMTS